MRYNLRGHDSLLGPDRKCADSSDFMRVVEDAPGLPKRFALTCASLAELLEADKEHLKFCEGIAWACPTLCDPTCAVAGPRHLAVTLDEDESGALRGRRAPLAGPR